MSAQRINRSIEVSRCSQQTPGTDSNAETDDESIGSGCDGRDKVKRGLCCCIGTGRAQAAPRMDEFKIRTQLAAP